MKSQPVPPHEMSYLAGNVTAVSQAKVAKRRGIRHLWSVARLSLFVMVLSALGGPGCLITSSPDFTKPERTPPFLTNVSPPTYQIVPIKAVPGTVGMYLPPPPISFEIVSEDLQTASLQALLLLDFKGFESPDVPQRLWGKDKIPAGHLNSEPRRVEVDDYDFRGVPPGCHSATLAVTHEFIDLGAPKTKPVDDRDVALVTWWFDLAGDPGAGNLLSTCVVRGGTTGDAGADGEAGGP
jgi:hypothetical protein